MLLGKKSWLFWGKNESFKVKNRSKLLAICILDDDNRGIFVIPKDELVKNNILAIANNKVKMVQDSILLRIAI